MRAFSVFRRENSNGAHTSILAAPAERQDENAPVTFLSLVLARYLTSLLHANPAKSIADTPLADGARISFVA